MKAESTQMAAEIYAASSEMETDLACKRVLALKDILARILQRVVREYEPYAPEEIAERFINSTQIQLFKEEDFDLLELILVRLGDKETEDELLGMLTTLLWKKMSAESRMQELEERYGVPMKREVVKEVANMCSYSAAIKERAMDEGLALGRSEGRNEGLTLGKAGSICILLESLGELPASVKERILSESDEELLTTWLKLTRQVDTWQEFCQLAQIEMV